MILFGSIKEEESREKKLIERVKLSRDVSVYKDTGVYVSRIVFEKKISNQSELCCWHKSLKIENLLQFDGKKKIYEEVKS